METSPYRFTIILYLRQNLESKHSQPMSLDLIAFYAATQSLSKKRLQQDGIVSQRR